MSPTDSDVAEDAGLDVDLLSGATYERPDAADVFARIRRERPVFRDTTNGIWGVTRHADVAYVSRHPELFCSRKGHRPNFPPDNTMLAMDDPEHGELRARIRKAFTPRIVAAMEDHARDITTELLDGIDGRDRIDFVDDVAIHLPLIVLAELLGVDPDDRAQFRQWSDDILASADGGFQLKERSRLAFIAYHEYCQGIFADRQANPRDDLMTAVVQAEIDGVGLTDWERFAFAFLLLVAGNETTRNGISGSLLTLLQHPDQLAALRADDTLWPTAIEEMLRWVSPVMNFRRTATADTTLGDVDIAEGDQVLLLYGVANRDPDVFDDPERFDVTRTPNPHLAFGVGTHFCLGANLARLEMRVLLSEFLARFPDARLDPDGEVERTGSAFVAGIETLPLLLHR